MTSIAPILGFVLFLVILAVVDRALGWWGSEAIHAKPRPGGRVTAIFIPVVVVAGLLELLAEHVWATLPGVAVAILAGQLVVCPAVAVAVDWGISRWATGTRRR